MHWTKARLYDKINNLEHKKINVVITNDMRVIKVMLFIFSIETKWVLYKFILFTCLIFNNVL